MDGMEEMAGNSSVCNTNTTACCRIEWCGQSGVGDGPGVSNKVVSAAIGLCRIRKSGNWLMAVLVAFDVVKLNTVRNKG